LPRGILFLRTKATSLAAAQQAAGGQSAFSSAVPITVGFEPVFCVLGRRMLAAAISTSMIPEKTQRIDYQYFNLNWVSIIFLMI
jgi:hypothetical protein